MWDIVDGLNTWYKEHYKDKGFFIISSVTETNRVAKVFKTIKTTLYYVRYNESGKPVNTPILNTQINYRVDSAEDKANAERGARAEMIKLILDNIDKIKDYGRHNELE